MADIDVGTTVRCKSHQTNGTFEGTVKDKNVSQSGSVCFLVTLTVVNGAALACPFDRWTSIDEVEDWD